MCPEESELVYSAITRVVVTKVCVGGGAGKVVFFLLDSSSSTVAVWDFR